MPTFDITLNDSYVSVETNEDTYFLQMPDCQDSEHKNSIGNDIDQDGLSEKLLNAIYKKYPNNQNAHFYTAWEYVYVTDLSLKAEYLEECFSEEYFSIEKSLRTKNIVYDLDIYVVINASDTSEYMLFTNSDYSDYYNIELWDKFKEDSLTDDSKQELDSYIKHYITQNNEVK